MQPNRIYETEEEFILRLVSPLGGLLPFSILSSGCSDDLCESNYCYFPLDILDQSNSICIINLSIWQLSKELEKTYKQVIDKKLKELHKGLLKDEELYG